MMAKEWKQHSKSGGIYFLGFIASAVYFIQAAVGFGQGLLGLLKALVWPAFLIYRVFVVLHV
jgi:hypothetical protein